MKYLIFLFTICLFACNQSKMASSSDSNMFGEKITTKGVISYDEMLAKIEGKEKLEAKVKGTVESVCQVKGCWMNIVSKDAEKQEMFVKFKDYGFFMPLDISGKEVIMDGYAFYEITSVDELRHYAEDAGKSKEEIAAITEPETELKFMAHGVILVDNK